ncbi:MAG TPA: bifunctional UDP-N-acetylglucosamine diphosphorylase/glucosamine-1-phosphate N-acetyltransferase GlmU, partial [Thermomicrobiales bacterium]|nr:bifunctional UDP-N-acetylglucosamine diphosphorylase/glucosamine-1-phosphate N-acetyltransferase GlmU [Thermomicrobiales bacterium]
AAHPADRRVAVVILAAGVGSRMRSALPKPLHPVAGVPMTAHVFAAAAGAEPGRVVLVVGPHSRDLAARLGLADDVVTVVQDSPRGTGDAVRVALPAVGGADWAVVLYADHPLLEPETVARLVAVSRESQALATILTTTLPDAAGYGRIERDAANNVTRIVERADDEAAARVGSTEINSGMMALAVDWARAALADLPPSPVTGEFYLTDLVARAVVGHPAGAPWPVAAVEGPPDVALGVNDRVELAAADGRLRQRIRERLMRSGVSFVGPETSFVDADVAIGPDTTIFPGSLIAAGTTIGAGCTIGPHAVIRASRVGDNVTIRGSTLDAAIVGAGSDVGPYSHLRPGATLGERVHVGNFTEIKNSRLGDGAKSGHFSYLGDAEIGPNANIGAGTITANYDGEHKHPTVIGARAFIGSDTILRAPVTIGDDARTGAGSVVTKDVPAGATAVGVPARIVRGGHGETEKGA